MGMSIDRSLKVRDQVLSRLADLYNSAEMFGWMTSSDLNAKAIEIKAALDKCPQWVKSWIDGWERCRRDIISRKVVFFYTMPDGQLLSTHRNRSDYYEKHGIGPKEVYEQATHSGHYWVIVDHKGEEQIRPYFVEEM